MNNKEKKELKNRLSSFVWRLGGMGLVAILSFLLDNAGVLEINPYIQVVMGLVIGEISKHLNKK